MFIKYSITNLSLGLAALGVATVALLLLARIIFRAHNSLFGTLQKKYDQDLKKVRTLDFIRKIKKALLDLEATASFLSSYISKYQRSNYGHQLFTSHVKKIY